MSMNHETRSPQAMTRRRLLEGAAGAMAVAAGLPAVAQAARRQRVVTAGQQVITKGRIQQSVCAWCFKPMPLETLAQNCAAMGVKSVELVDPKDWPILKKYGLICAMTSSHDLTTVSTIKTITQCASRRSSGGSMTARQPDSPP